MNDLTGFRYSGPPGGYSGPSTQKAVSDECDCIFALKVPSLGPVAGSQGSRLSSGFKTRQIMQVRYARSCLPPAHPFRGSLEIGMNDFTSYRRSG